MLSRFARDESGGTAIEYGLIVGIVFLGIVTAVTYYCDSTGAMYGRISAAIAAVAG